LNKFFKSSNQNYKHDQIIVQQKDELGQLQVDLQQKQQVIKQKQKDLQQLDVQIAKQQTAAQAFYCKNSN
jgi:chromosome segregation protein